jgi:hypothetical protein
MLKKVFLTIVFLLIAIAGYKFAIDNQLIAARELPKPLAGLFSTFSFESPEAAEQTQVLSSRAQEVGGHVQQVLGTAVEAAPEEKKPIHTRAVEYGRYVYCKQVVKEYESQ